MESCTLVCQYCGARAEVKSWYTYGNIIPWIPDPKLEHNLVEWCSHPSWMVLMEQK